MVPFTVHDTRTIYQLKTEKIDLKYSLFVSMINLNLRPYDTISSLLPDPCSAIPSDSLLTKYNSCKTWRLKDKLEASWKNVREGV